MARCAVVRTIDNEVVNIIMADASTDLPPNECFLVDIDNYTYVNIGWFYDPVMIDFVPPPTISTE